MDEEEENGLHRVRTLLLNWLNWFLRVTASFRNACKCHGRIIWFACSTALALAVWRALRRVKTASTALVISSEFSEFLHRVASGVAQNVVIQEDSVVYSSDNKIFKTTVMPSFPYGWLITTLAARRIPFTFRTRPRWRETLAIFLLSWVPLVAFTAYLRHQISSKDQQEDVARNANMDSTNASFSSVVGIPEAKQEVEEIVDMLKKKNSSSTSMYTQMGCRVPRGILLVGKPGTGKTLLARALAVEAQVPFFHCSGSDFVELYVGRGAARIREMFKRAKRRSPCIVFIDEIDSVAMRRPTDDSAIREWSSSSSHEYSQSLNALLTCLDGLNREDGVLVLAATNRISVIDEALIRPGRFDRIVNIPLPDTQGRSEILKHYLKNCRAANSVDPEKLAEKMENMTGADLEAVVNEGTVLCLRRGANAVEQQDFLDAAAVLISRRSPRYH